jgi:hypothetical protein
MEVRDKLIYFNKTDVLIILEPWAHNSLGPTDVLPVVYICVKLRRKNY